MRRSFVRRRRAHTGILRLKVVRNFNVTLSDTTNTNVTISPAFSDFPELETFATTFEAYRFHYCKVKVTPYGNTSSWDGQVPPYVSASYKKPFDNEKLNADKLLSLDNSRQYHGNSTSMRTFVPAIHIQGAAGTDLFTSGVIKWRPRIEIQDTSSGNIPHYCGIYSFPPSVKDPAGDAANMTYWFRIECMVTLYNQKLDF